MADRKKTNNDLHNTTQKTIEFDEGKFEDTKV